MVKTELCRLFMITVTRENHEKRKEKGFIKKKLFLLYKEQFWLNNKICSMFIWDQSSQEANIQIMN